MKSLITISILGVLLFIDGAVASCKKFRWIPGLYELCKAGGVVADAVSAYTDIVKRGQAIIFEKLLQTQKVSQSMKHSQKIASYIMELKKEEIQNLHKIAYLSILASLIGQQEYKFVMDEAKEEDIYDFLIIYEKLSDKEVREFCELLPERC